MGLFSRKKDPAEKLLKEFLNQMKKEGFDVFLFDKKEIQKKCKISFFLPTLKTSLRKLKYRRISLVLQVNNPKSSWISSYLDRNVINCHNVGNSRFDISLARTDEEMMGIEEELRSIKL